jgi:phosphotriesterase-related protein
MGGEKEVGNVATVNTVLGPVDTADLGFTLSHEHIMTSAAGIRQTYPQYYDYDGVIEDAVAALREAHDQGLRTIIDMTTFDLGRDVNMLAQVSRRSGVHIIATTGSHRSIPRIFATASPNAIAPLFIQEIEQGIEGTGIKAGVIKSASDAGGITEQEEIVLRAVARAQKHTGVPISTHTWSPDRVGDQQVRILEEEGVDLNRVYIGHSNDDTDLDYLLGLLEKGVWLGLDRFPGGRIPGTPNWEQRTEMIKRLIDAGYGHRIMLSHDHSIPRGQATPELREQRQRYNPDGYLFIIRRVLPRLKELGVSQEDIHRITEENPRRFFEGN